MNREINGWALFIHHVIRALILFGFAMYIVYLVKTDYILLYIAPRMLIYVKLSAIALYAVAIYQVYLALLTLWGEKQLVCECQQPPSRSFLLNSVIYGLFILPLVLGFIVPETVMGSSMASKKGISLSGSQAPRSSSTSSQTIAPAGTNQAPSSSTVNEQLSIPPSLPNQQGSEQFPADEYMKPFAKYAEQLFKKDMIVIDDDLFMESLTALDMYASQFVDKQIQLQGFVYRQEGMKPNQFVVARFALNCCSADAMPYGVIVEYDRASTYADDTWVELTGIIQQINYNDMDLLSIKTQKIIKIAPPQNPYVYPNLEFGI